MIHLFEVENIKCGGCANSIKTALLKINQVEAIEINKENETVSVTGNADVSEIIAKLNALGYPVKGTNSTFKQLKSYVSCAIGKMNES